MDAIAGFPISIEANSNASTEEQKKKDQLADKHSHHCRFLLATPSSPSDQGFPQEQEQPGSGEVKEESQRVRLLLISTGNTQNRFGHPEK